MKSEHLTKICPWFGFTTVFIAISAALTQSALATLVTRSVNHTLTAIPDGSNNSFDLDVDLDGTTDFTFTTIIGIPDMPSFASFAVIEAPFATSNGAIIDAFTGDGFPTVSRLSLGDRVSSSNRFFSASFDQGNLFFITSFDPPSGNFDNQSGFIGLRFEKNSEIFFGFAQVTVNDLFAVQDPLAVTIKTVGFESVAGEPVQIATVPEPSLATPLGIATVLGLITLRRRRDL
jgi:hypothetical protein